MHGHHAPRPTRVLARPADPAVRIGDAERDRVIDQLADHHAAGRLTLAEFEDRMAAAQTARTGADLATLVEDLPAATPTPRPPAQLSARRLALDPAVRTYLAVIALLWLIWLFTGAGYPWPIWPMLGWGLGVAGRAWRDPAPPPS
jgi:Domain of unknown function (DUF1707)/2TM domain